MYLKFVREVVRDNDGCNLGAIAKRLISKKKTFSKQKKSDRLSSLLIWR